MRNSVIPESLLVLESGLAQPLSGVMQLTPAVDARVQGNNRFFVPLHSESALLLPSSLLQMQHTPIPHEFI